MVALDGHVTPLRVSTRSKWWWTPEVTAEQNAYGRTRSLYQEGRTNAFTVRAEQNIYYYMVRRAKRQYRAAFLHGTDTVIGESERCWTVLRNTKPWSLFTTPALENTEGNQAITLEKKEEMVGRAAFTHPKVDPVDPPSYRSSRAHPMIDETTVQRVLFVQ